MTNTTHPENDQDQSFEEKQPPLDGPSEKEDPKNNDDVDADDDDDDDDDDESSADDDDDDLVLEGVLVRNPDVSDSEDNTDTSDEESEGMPQQLESKSVATNNVSLKKRSPSNDTKNPPTEKKKKSKKSKTTTTSGPEIIPVEFTYCDMHERYFHGLKTLLASSSPVYGVDSSSLADIIIDNVSVGTVISTDADKEEGTVYGFASVLSVTTYQDKECIQNLKKLCLSHCPDPHKAELETVLSGKTKRPAGFLLQSRMVNLPLEIVEVLHQQLVLDMDWAVEHAEGGEEERKSLNFGAFVRVAPSYRSSGDVIYYKYFDDEIFAQHAEFFYEITLPHRLEADEKPRCTVIVMTRTGHQAAVQDLKNMVNGATTTSS